MFLLDKWFLIMWHFGIDGLSREIKISPKERKKADNPVFHYGINLFPIKNFNAKIC